MQKKKIKILLLAAIVLISSIYGCSVESDRIYDQETVKICKPAKQPLKHAMALIGIQLSHLARPDYYEAGYNMICRMPIIDNVSRSPFALHKWADETSSQFLNNSNASTNDVLKIVTNVIKGGSSDHLAHKKETAIIGLIKAYESLCHAHGSSVDKNNLKKIKDAAFSDEFDLNLGQLVYEISEASLLAKKAFSSLTKEESKFLLSRPERFFFPKKIHFDFLTAPVFAQEKIKSTEGAPDPSYYFKNKEIGKGVVLKISSPIGDIVILGQENNVINGNAAIIIDIGGNDRYVGNIADGRFVPGRISVAIDLNGDDIYDSKTNPFSQGFGCMSIGLLIDLDGNDRYISGNMSQGCGIYGVGILEDLAGDDVYLMGLMGQGFGVFGTGILLDRNGNDRYMINGLGQGAGSTMGFGCIIDADGNDKYIADNTKTRGKLIPDDLMNHVQGSGLSIRSPEWPKQFSFYGGVGFLNDGKGDDFYYSNGGNCMGSSYFMSLGVLVDHQGNDYYMPEKGYGIGSAVHLTNAVFIDRKGNDQYFAEYHTGGAASDQSVGIMIDYEGNDIYGPSYDYLKKTIQKELDEKKEEISISELKDRINKRMADASYGAALKPKALGMLVDYKGNDQYFSREGGYGESCGGVIPPVDPGNWSHALLLDLDGKDHYFKKGMNDNHYVKYFQHGLCYDTRNKGYDIFNNNQKNETLNSQKKKSATAKKIKKGVIYNDIEELLKTDSLIRYSAIGKIIENGTDTVLEVINLVKESGDNELNRDLIEILNTFIIKKQFEKKHRKLFEKLLKAKDPFVRSFTAHTFGVHKDKESVNSLIKSINDENEKVRYHTMWALGQIGDLNASDALISTALKDVSLDCRRVAVKSLSDLIKKHKNGNGKTKQKIVDVLMQSAISLDDKIRFYAVSGLRYYAEEPKVANVLKELLKDESVYVKRASAKAIIEKGNKKGIPVLIETLKYPSIDTFEFYGHDLIKEIALYCGVDFPKEKRYLYSTWMKWWEKNKKNVNIKRNLSIKKDIEDTFYVKHESKGIEIFKQLFKENPENIVIKNSFVQFCYEWINYKFLTREKITTPILERCIVLQKNIIEMEPEDSKHRIKLANLYARLSKYKLAADAMKSAVNREPDNQKILKVWKKYKRLAGN
ncbi:MAG: HEAT repeat domain-containing protein [Deltaproteobacteria bacterium]|nr:HEAT repeat domain-containing protein [Deltaproteobacteria bacterium]